MSTAIIEVLPATGITPVKASINGKIVDDGGATWQARFMYYLNSFNHRLLPSGHAAGTVWTLPDNAHDNDLETSSYRVLEWSNWTDALELTYPETVANGVDIKADTFKGFAGTKYIKLEICVNGSWIEVYNDVLPAVEHTYLFAQNYVISGLRIYLKDDGASVVGQGHVYEAKLCLPDMLALTEWQPASATLVTDDTYTEALEALLPNTEYLVRTQTKNLVDESDWSDESSFTTLESINSYRLSIHETDGTLVRYLPNINSGYLTQRINEPDSLQIVTPEDLVLNPGYEIWVEDMRTREVISKCQKVVRIDDN